MFFHDRGGVPANPILHTGQPQENTISLRYTLHVSRFPSVRLFLTPKPGFDVTVVTAVFSFFIAVRNKIPATMQTSILIDGSIVFHAFVLIFIPPGIPTAIRTELLGSATLLLPDWFLTVQA